MGAAGAWWVAVTLAAGGFSFEGVSGRAQTSSERAFFATGQDPSVEEFADARGSAVLTTRDRIDAPAATYGDRATFEANVRVGLEDYRIELVEVGAPPRGTAEGEAVAQPGFGVSVEGGVRVADQVFGRTGFGLPRAAQAQAALALFGRARIARNGVVIDERAPVQIFALSTGIHADDETHRRLPGARVHDTELIVFVPSIDSGLVETDYLLFTFEDVNIEVAGRQVRSVATVPTTGAPVTGVAVAVELSELPQISPAQFDGFRNDLVTRDGLPVEPIRTPQGIEPGNVAPASPLPATAGVAQTAPPSLPSTPSPTLQSEPLPASVDPGNATPATPVVSGPSILPGNAVAATPLPAGVEPLNALPTPGITTGLPTPTPGDVSPGTTQVPAAPTGQLPVLTNVPPAVTSTPLLTPGNITAAPVPPAAP